VKFRYSLLTLHYILNVSGFAGGKDSFLSSYVTEGAGRNNDTQRKDGGAMKPVDFRDGRTVPLSGRRFS